MHCKAYAVCEGLNVHLYRMKGGALGFLQATRGARQLTEVRY